MKPARATAATVSDLGLVVVGAAFIASAFSNVPVKISGLVNLQLSAPGALTVQLVFAVVGFALLIRGLSTLLDAHRHVATATVWWRRRQEPRPADAPGLNVGRPPGRNPLFTGRDEELTELARRLANERRVDLSGLGGVGKSSLAIEYLHVHRREYPAGVFWLRGETETTLSGDFAALAWLEELNLPDRADPAQERAITGVTIWLRTHPGWLLVVDNLDGELIPVLDKLLARGLEGHVLVTCRIPVWSRPLEVGPLSPDVAIGYLLARTGQHDDDSAAEVASLLDYLPLALEQAAAFMRSSGRSLADYAELARSRLDQLMREGKPRDYPDPVATTWSLSFGRIEQESPPAAAMLRLCAFLAPDGIPVRVLSCAAEQLEGELARSLRDELRLDLAIGVLKRYALVDRHGGMLRIHRLVQSVVRASATRQDWLAVVLRTLRATFPDNVREPKTWSGAAELLPHVQAAVGYVGRDEVVEDATVGWLADRAASYLQARGEFGPARPLFERAREIREHALGPEHPDTAASINGLARVLCNLGELAATKPMYERALEIRERVLGPNDPDTATTLNNLAGLLQIQGRLAAARPLRERALEIRERVLGPDHPDTAESFNDLASLLRVQGDLAAARPLFERALEISERVLGPDHPETATNLDNLALLFQDQGELVAARPLYERALDIRERVLGPDHPDTAASLNNLARLLLAQGELSTARPNYERALDIRERVLGPDHPDTAASLNNLARLLRAQGDLATARPLFERALEIRKRTLGPDHPLTITTRGSLHELLALLGEPPAPSPTEPASAHAPNDGYPWRDADSPGQIQ